MDELPQFQRSQMAKYDGKQGEFAAWWLCLQDGFKCSAPMSQDNQLLNAKALLQGTARQTSDDAERVARILTAGGGPPLMEAWAEKMTAGGGSVQGGLAERLVSGWPISWDVRSPASPARRGP
jgi:hypothetical protein